MLLVYMSLLRSGNIWFSVGTGLSSVFVPLLIFALALWDHVDFAHQLSDTRYTQVLLSADSLGRVAVNQQPLACYFSGASPDQKREPADTQLFVSAASRDFSCLAPAVNGRLRPSPQVLGDICADWTHLRGQKKQSGKDWRQERVKKRHETVFGDWKTRNWCNRVRAGSSRHLRSFIFRVISVF